MHNTNARKTANSLVSDQVHLDESGSNEGAELVILQQTLEASLSENETLWRSNAALIRELSQYKRLSQDSGLNTDGDEGKLQGSARNVTQLKKALIQKERQRYNTEQELRRVLATSSYSVTFGEAASEIPTDQASRPQNEQALKLTAAERKIAELSSEVSFIKKFYSHHKHYRSKMVAQLLSDINKNGGSEITKYRGGYIFLISYPHAGETYIRDTLRQIEGVHTWHRQSYRQFSSLLAVYRRLISLEVSTPVSVRALGLNLAESFLLSLKLPDDLPASTTIAVNLTNDFIDPDEVAEFVDFALMYFPGSRIVFGTRQPEAVALSGNWKSQPREKVVSQVSDLNDAFNRCAQIEDAHRVFILRYEDRQKRPALVKHLFARLSHRRV